MQPSPKAVSAPGKVLLAGGYLVLDRAHTGLVFGLAARIHVHIQPLPIPDSEDIVVCSPQFTNATWRYGYKTLPNDGGVEVTQMSEPNSTVTPSRNSFVETTLSYALTYISTHLPHSIALTPARLTILADNDYYSQSTSTPASLATTTATFTNFAIPLSSAHKTGLGSSAALVTSLTAALLSFYLPTTPPTPRTLHNLSQAAHSAAQGKIGSGFDVASAVYGSCVYRRFSPSLLAGLGEVGSAGFAGRLADVVDERGEEHKWDTEVRRAKVRVPAGLRLAMCDVTGGSETPGMVRQVLQWRAAAPEAATALWSEIQELNDGLAAELVRVAERRADDGTGDAAGSAPVYGHLRELVAAVRARTRAMSAASGVPIEPPAQTALLDAAAERVPGVLGGVVPGAGGFDAAVFLIEDREEVVRALEAFVREWKFDGGERGRVRLLGVRESMEGVRVEDGGAEAYAGWVG